MARKPSAGSLNIRVAFDKRPTENPDSPVDYGNTEGDFEEQFRRWARFTHGGGTEAIIAARLQGRNIMRVHVRYDSDTRQITTDWRMRDVNRGTEYAVRHVDSITDRAFVYLEVESGVAA